MTTIFKYANISVSKGKGNKTMFYSTDCNYVIKVFNKPCWIECYTKEQVKRNIRHETGCSVYKVLNNGKLELMSHIKPTK